SGVLLALVREKSHRAFGHSFGIVSPQRADARSERNPDAHRWRGDAQLWEPLAERSLATPKGRILMGLCARLPIRSLGQILPAAELLLIRVDWCSFVVGFASRQGSNETARRS